MNTNKNAPVGLLGAAAGDIVGSVYEWHNHKSKDFPLFKPGCKFTDDTVMTFAIAQALLGCDGDFSDLSRETINSMQAMGKAYPHAGYGGRFREWLTSWAPQPYYSYGNGAAMRVSSVAYVAESLEQVKELSRKVTAVTHDHPEGLKGAEAVAVAIWLALHGAEKAEIGDAMKRDYYPLDFTLDQIREDYRFDVSCQGSVPQAIEAFLESESFEDAIRLAVSIGGDSDTIAAITGSIAEAYYGIPEDIKKQTLSFLDQPLRELYRRWEDAR